jgi:serine phosphatase RsbU (regulator of sigma subunit)/pSer/pThr/pTyr-binding forkhead associated (FHA) protein
MAEIRIESADGASRRVTLDKERFTIGRSRENDIFLPDQWLSRHHAEVRTRATGYVLVDLGSKNGTLLNGARLAGEQALREGDLITLGEHRLTFSNAISDETDDDMEPIGTRIFPAKEISDVVTKPVEDPGELVRQNRLLRTLSQAASDLLIHRSLDELFNRILELLMEAVPAERAAILIVEAGSAHPIIKASKSRAGAPITKVSRSIARRALEERVSLLLPNLLEDQAFKTQDSILSSGIRSALCAPLWFTGEIVERDAVIGLVYMDSMQRSHSFTEDDIRVVTAVANIAAVQIENARLMEENIEKRQLEDDMRKAAEIQQRLLPGAPPILAGYDVAGSNHPCRTVGGDYFDYLQTPDRLYLALGDVSGKGTGAALLMTVLRAAVRAHWTEFEPAEAVGRINRTVCQNIPDGKFATFAMARLDPATGDIVYVNAGHNPPILARADGTLEELTEGGMVLGMFDPVPYVHGCAHLDKGDTLVIFSDGVSETWDKGGEEYGEARLAQAIRRDRALSAARIEASILTEIDLFSGGAKATDDRTLIVLKRV